MKDLYKELDETQPLDYLRRLDFRSAYFKPLVRDISTMQKELRLSNGLLNVAIEYSYLRHEHVSTHHLSAMISFLRKRCATDAESAINVIREANLKRK